MPRIPGPGWRDRDFGRLRSLSRRQPTGQTPRNRPSSTDRREGRLGVTQRRPQTRRVTAARWHFEGWRSLPPRNSRGTTPWSARRTAGRGTWCRCCSYPAGDNLWHLAGMLDLTGETKSPGTHWSSRSTSGP